VGLWVWCGSRGKPPAHGTTETWSVSYVMGAMNKIRGPLRGKSLNRGVQSRMGSSKMHSLATLIEHEQRAARDSIPLDGRGEHDTVLGKDMFKRPNFRGDEAEKKDTVFQAELKRQYRTGERGISLLQKG